jgi:hypothetical protein
MQQLIEVLIENYGFELSNETPQELAVRWLDEYDAHWVRLAIIEALYLGRYKAVSVEQILTLWSSRGQPKFHFTHEFERLICRRLPTALRQLARQAEQQPISPAESTSAATREQDKEDVIDVDEADEEYEEEYEEDEESETNHPFSINRFTPLLDRSEFYSKLKAVADYQTN